MKTVVVLAMHGAPPRDFPRPEMAEFFSLHSRLSHATPTERPTLELRYAELDARMRAWPRTMQNDPFHAAAHDLAGELARVTGYPVLVGFNEFCAPTLDEALDQATAHGAERVAVITPMMTRGGGHAEVDIPATLQRARERHAEIAIDYVWPFDTSEVARFLAAQMRRAIS